MSAPQSSRTGSEYAQVPKMRPFDPIPPPRQDAVEWVIRAYNTLLESAPSLVREFEARFETWQNTWHETFKTQSAARACCDVDEVNPLLNMGSQIIPLVLYQLLDPGNFVAVYLYNRLEKDRKYLIDPGDVLNFLTLQRQNNLIIDINYGREW
ncbi:hypothetical protein F4777DRAFT_318255 [Nemania sp. FL0916]|nr:hypothetical protein F4777DRAFT_318255 [Nemania sp. FL0916]